MHAEATVRAYDDALWDGESLYQFFGRGESTAKFAIGERVTGYHEVRSGPVAGPARTEEWVVDSKRRVLEAGDHQAWLSNEVCMPSTDTERERHSEFDTRWSGTLQRREDEADLPADWQLVGTHLSTEGATA